MLIENVNINKQNVYNQTKDVTSDIERKTIKVW